MKQLVRVVIAAIAGSSLGVSAGAADPPRLAVLELLAEGVDVETTWSIEERLHEELAASRRVSVVPANEMRVALEAAGKDDRTCFAPECAREFAKLLEVEIVVIGRASRAGRELLLELEVWNVRRDRNLYSDVFDAVDTDALLAKMKDAAAAIADALGAAPAEPEAPELVEVEEAPAGDESGGAGELAEAEEAPVPVDLPSAREEAGLEPAKKGGGRKWLWIGGGAVAVAGGALLLGGGGGGGGGGEPLPDPPDHL